MARNAWKVVDRCSLSPNANVIGARFYYTVKNPGTNRERPKSRFVAQGFKDVLKYFFVHNSPALRQCLTKLILSAASVISCKTSMVDFIQACLQKNENLVATSSSMLEILT